MIICDKPFIYLFKTPNCHYFYDVNKDSIVNISKDIYDYLSGSTSSDELKNEDIEMLGKLKERGYLSSNRVKDIVHPDSDNLRFLLNNNLQQLILQVTQSCNLVCSYCPYANRTDGILQRNHSSKHMSWETAKKCIDFYAEHSTAAESIAICFYGGEPLLAIDLIVQCIGYANELFLDKEVVYYITTNGTLLTDEMMVFFAENNVKLTFSIDGPASIHDEYRKRADGRGSFEAAYSNLEKAVSIYNERGSTQSININMVVNPEGNLREVLKLFDKPLFASGRVAVNSGIVGDDDLEKKYIPTDEFIEVYSYQDFLGYMSYFGLVDGLKMPKLVEAYFSSLDKTYLNFKEKQHHLPETMAPGGPCIPGQRRLFVNADGVFYPCERVSELSSIMQIGSIDAGFDYKKALMLLNVGAITADNCRNCYAFIHCITCARTADGGNCLSPEVKLSRCDRSRAAFQTKLLDCALIKERKTIYKGVIK